MKQWIRWIIRALVLFLFLLGAAYIFVPSTLSLREVAYVRCPQNAVYLKLQNPYKWLTESSAFRKKIKSFNLDSVKNSSSPTYKILLNNNDTLFISLKEQAKYSQLIFEFNYRNEITGEFSFNLTNMLDSTEVKFVLEADLEDNLWKKVESFFSYSIIKRTVVSDLESIASDCKQHTNMVRYKILTGEIPDFRALVKKISIVSLSKSSINSQISAIQKKVPQSMIAGSPFIQYTNNPFADTLNIIVGIPIKEGTVKLERGYSLMLFTKYKTLKTSFNLNLNDVDNVYNQLLYFADVSNLHVEDYPIVFFKNGELTMEVPVDK